jgi:hypothetical protein
LSSRSNRFRLLAALPLDVAFRGVTDRLAISQMPVSGAWQLRAEWPSGFWLCGHAASEQALRKAVSEDGLELRRSTVPWLIFERLVKERMAQSGDSSQGLVATDSDLSLATPESYLDANNDYHV